MAREKSRLVFTEKGKCRRCYTCVRECPAKAIKITGGQANIIPSRCIGCGNCVLVCSQNAKKYRSSLDQVQSFLEGPEKTIALVDPSFPAEFHDFEDYRYFVGLLHSLGFDYVSEAAFGADLVARKYLELMEKKEGYYITSTCPAVVSFIEKYYPDLIGFMAPIVSPMLAMGMVVRKKYGANIKTVFIGPCVAKKSEAETPEFDQLINAVITFSELRTLIRQMGQEGISPSPAEFDPPIAGKKGALSPVNRNILSPDLKKDLLVQEILVAEGRIDFPEALKEFNAGFHQAMHFDFLCHQGCIMGPGVSKELKKFAKGEHVKKYVSESKRSLDLVQWEKEMALYSTLDLSRGYTRDDQRIPAPDKHLVEEILRKMGKVHPEDELNCGTCGYDTCRDHAEAILVGLAESEMCFPYVIEKLHQSIEELANTEKALRQSEKLATMGQLSAGIAHEVNNPLGIVLLYSHLLMEKMEPGSPMYEDMKMIAVHADRCKNIICGLLNFARKNEVQLSDVNISELIKASLKDVYIPKKIEIKVIDRMTDPWAAVDLGQIIQVFTNIIKNAVDVMGCEGKLTITAEDNIREISVSFGDSGPGIPKERLDKIFEPFFTTKPMGKGTGLGLSVSYGIVKMHCGQIKVSTNCDQEKGETGTVFTVVLPRRRN